MVLSIVLMLCAFFFAVGAVGIWGGYTQRRQTQIILERGVPARATVTQVHEDRTRNGRYFYVDYQYQVEGQTYDREEGVAYNYFRDLSAGSQVSIRYLRESPGDTARITDEGAGVRASNNLMITGVGFIGVAVIVAIISALTIPSSLGDSQSAPTPVPTVAPPAGFAEIRAAVEPRIPALRKAAGDDPSVHFLSAADAGLPASLGVSGIDYGSCQNQGFYTIVLLQWAESRVQGKTEGYHANAYSYIIAGHPVENLEFCAPRDFSLMQQGYLGQGWNLSLVVTTSSTPPPGATIGPVP